MVAPNQRAPRRGQRHKSVDTVPVLHRASGHTDIMIRAHFQQDVRATLVFAQQPLESDSLLSDEFL
jgi:hypothetical protein